MHTPGPWLAEPNERGTHSVVAFHFDANVASEVFGVREIEGEAEANARLIAACPDMRQALGLTLTNINGALLFFGKQKNVDLNTIKQLWEWRHIVVAAICKADGTDPDAYADGL